MCVIDQDQVIPIILGPENQAAAMSSRISYHSVGLTTLKCTLLGYDRSLKSTNYRSHGRRVGQGELISRQTPCELINSGYEIFNNHSPECDGNWML